MIIPGKALVIGLVAALALGVMTVAGSFDSAAQVGNGPPNAHVQRTCKLGERVPQVDHRLEALGQRVTSPAIAIGCGRRQQTPVLLVAYKVPKSLCFVAFIPKGGILLGGGCKAGERSWGQSCPRSCLRVVPVAIPQSGSRENSLVSALTAQTVNDEKVEIERDGERLIRKPIVATVNGWLQEKVGADVPFVAVADVVSPCVSASQVELVWTVKDGRERHVRGANVGSLHC